MCHLPIDRHGQFTRIAGAFTALLCEGTKKGDRWSPSLRSLCATDYRAHLSARVTLPSIVACTATPRCSPRQMPRFVKKYVLWKVLSIGISPCALEKSNCSYEILQGQKMKSR